MKDIIEIFIISIILLPFVLYAIYCVVKPREGYLLGRRWEFNGEPEPSECAIDIHRIFAIVFLIIIVVVVVLSIIGR